MQPREKMPVVRLVAGTYGDSIRTMEYVPAHCTVFHLVGEVEPAPSKYSLQIDKHMHLLTPNELWRYVNHSCDPNLRIDVVQRMMIAIRDIPSGDELTFSYNTTEWSMAAPFECQCGSPKCHRTIRGFSYLTATQQREVLPLSSPCIQRASQSLEDSPNPDLEDFPIFESGV